jgi:hypothetical protein
MDYRFMFIIRKILYQFMIVDADILFIRHLDRFVIIYLLAFAYSVLFVSSIFDSKILNHVMLISVFLLTSFEYISYL